ncbi:clavaminate synthase-like protein [Coleophoma cylindrospora]|uniref:Clavaminate synthase-like protein n=1 Tax=Coleophoma cylindrospora TaxID=1849047 RepID=A0A3D8QKN9_9HELO|nr:clavaminate synthase-like protein [Coleophoma cylindrospora]
MSPSRTKEELVVTPIKHAPEKKCSMGAIITGLDLNDISDEELEQLRAATHKYQVVVIKNQHNLDPVKHWDLVTRLDPTAPNVHGHGTVKQFQKTGGLLSKRDVHGIPTAPNVRLIGKGYQGDDHFGIKNFTAYGASNDYHATPPSKEAFAAGNTQFQRWHMDAPLYEREPPHFTALRCVKAPVGPEITINWDDGTGLSMKTKPGLTAFFSNVQLYDLLSEEEKEMAENSWVEYAPFPYMWIENCKGNANGLGLVTQGKEHTMEEMPEWNPDFVKTYPMVWNTADGRKALQVHGIAVRKLFIKATPTSSVEVVDDVVKIRAFLHNWQSRIHKPEYILMAPVEEGDVGMWDNWSVFHSAVDYPDAYGVRSMHQANLGASDAPVGPRPIGVL